MHYIYTLFYIASEEGLPLIRPIFYEFPNDPNTFGLADQFMFGGSILIAAKVEAPRVSNQHKRASGNHNLLFQDSQ